MSTVVEPRAGRRSTFASLAVPNYRRYAAGQIVSLSGTWMQRVAQDWLVLDLSGGSATALGLAVALQFTPTLALSLWGGVLADLQVVRHRCADMATDVTRCRDAVLDAAARVDRDEDPATIALAASRAKVLVSERARSVTVDALRLAGGRGILTDEPWSRWYRRVKAAELVFGSPREHRAAVARAALAHHR